MAQTLALHVDTQNLLFTYCIHTTLYTELYGSVHTESADTIALLLAIGTYFVSTLVFLSHEKFAPYDLDICLGLLGCSTS